MIGGRVTEFLEAVIPLTVIGCGNLRVEIDVVMDTGFNGVALPVEWSMGKYGKFWLLERRAGRLPVCLC